MAKILGRTEEIVKTTVRILDGVRCDHCGKVISSKLYKTDRKAAKYFKVTTGHHDWGNDSCESIEYMDICSDCIADFVKEYLKGCSDTAYIEVEADLCYEMKVFE